MKKIAFISTMEGSPWGGSEELWSQTAERLMVHGHSIGVCVKWWPVVPLAINRMKQQGCVIDYRRPVGRLTRVVDKALQRSAFQWLNQFSPDLAVISQGSQYEGYQWALECLKRKIPYVLIAQAVSEEYWPNDDLASEVARAYESAVASYFVSEGNLKLARKQFGSILPGACVVRNPFNVPYTSDLGWPDDGIEIRFACVGRLDPKTKGQDILFDVLSLDKWRARYIHVTLFGSGPNFRTLKALSAQYDLKNITFAGFNSDVTSIWKENHALVLPSRVEGLPLAMVEAMLCGRPCVVTDVAGNAELIEDNVTGFVAAAPTAALLDEAMERAWQKRHEWHHIGALAARKVRENIPSDPVQIFADELTSLL